MVHFYQSYAHRLLNHKGKRHEGSLTLSRRQEGEKAKALAPFYHSLEHQVSASLGLVRVSFKDDE